MNQNTPTWNIGKATFKRDGGVALEGEITRIQIPASLEVLVVGLGASQEEVDEIAKLIAAVPELLSALKAALPILEESRYVKGLRNDANLATYRGALQAIAKAELK